MTGGTDIRQAGRGWRLVERQRVESELQALVGHAASVQIMDACSLASRETVLPWGNYYDDARRRILAGQDAGTVLVSIAERATLSSVPDQLALYDHLDRGTP